MRFFINLQTKGLSFETTKKSFVNIVDKQYILLWLACVVGIIYKQFSALSWYLSEMELMTLVRHLMIDKVCKRIHWTTHKVISLRLLSLFNWHSYAITLCPFTTLSSIGSDLTCARVKFTFYGLREARWKTQCEWTFALDIQKAFTKKKNCKTGFVIE